VDAVQFEAARQAVLSRRNPPGRVGENVANLFGGILRNARDGSTYYSATRSEAGGVCRVLLNKTSIEGQARAYTFPYAVFERQVLLRLREIDPASIDPARPPDEITLLQNELNALRARKTALALELLSGDVPEIAEAIRSLKFREEELLRTLGRDNQTVIVPRMNSWSDAQTLAGMLERASEAEIEDLRTRLRAALRRIVDEVWLLVVPRGRVRLCAVQAWFRDGEAQRTWLIYYRPGWAGRNGRREAESWSRSFAGETPLDLRRREHAAELAADLQAIDLADLEAQSGR
jgi:hypothetical protein